MSVFKTYLEGSLPNVVGCHWRVSFGKIPLGGDLYFNLTLETESTEKLKFHDVGYFGESWSVQQVCDKIISMANGAVETLNIQLEGILEQLSKHEIEGLYGLDKRGSMIWETTGG